MSIRSFIVWDNENRKVVIPASGDYIPVSGDVVFCGGDVLISGDVVFGENVNFNKHQALHLVIENRTADPNSPATGQIWYRTDL